MLKENELRSIKEQAVNATRKLSAVLIDALKPKPGAYALFYHNGNSIERLEDCWRICERLYRGRLKYTELSNELLQIEPKNWPAGTPYPANVQKVLNERHELNSYMKIDLESLYLFSMMALDQWGLQAIYVGHLPLKMKHPFVELISALERSDAGLLNDLWPSQKGQMLWLHYHLRFYRNRFVTHANRPWQRGQTLMTFGEDFRLFTPTPPGWLDDAKCDKEILSLIDLAPEYVRNLPDGHRSKEPRALIARLFDNIGNIRDRANRERVAELYGKVGGETPTFQITAERLISFLGQGTAILVDIVVNHPLNVDLGPPAKLSEELIVGKS